MLRQLWASKEKTLFTKIKDKSTIEITELEYSLQQTHSEKGGVFTPLTYAHYCGNDDLVLQIAKNFEPTKGDPEGFGLVLVRLLASGNRSQAQTSILPLIKEHTNLTHTVKGKNCLHWAVAQWPPEIVGAVLDNDPDRSIQDENGKTPIEFIESLFFGSTTSSHILKNPLSLVRLFTVKNASENDPEHYGQFLTNLLKWAANRSARHVFAQDLKEICTLLVQAQASLSFTDLEYGNTPLHWAFKMRDEDIIKILLPQAPLDVINQEQQTPLQLLSSHYSKDMNLFCTTLQEISHNRAAGDPKGLQDAFEILVQSPQHPSKSYTWKFLLQKVDAETLIKTRNKRMMSCLQYSIQSQDLDLCAAILEAQPQVIFTLDDKGDTAINYAVRGGDLRFIRLLLLALDKKFSEEFISQQLGKALLQCLESEHPKSVKEEMATLLFCYEDSLKEVNVNHDTVLHLTARLGLSSLYDLFAPKMSKELIIQMNLQGNTAIDLLPQSCPVPEFLYGPLEEESPQESLYKLIRKEIQQDPLRRVPVFTFFETSRTNEARKQLLELSEEANLSSFNSKLVCAIQYLEAHPLKTCTRLIEQLKEIQRSVSLDGPEALDLNF